MCIILTGEEEPVNTKILTVPIYINSIRYNLSVYLNSINMDRKNAILGIGFARTLPVKKNAKGVVMVIPYALPKNNKYPIALIDIADKRIKRFVEKTINTNSINPQNTYIINETVNSLYTISLANSIEDIEESIDWNQYTKPPDYNYRLQTFLDSKLYKHEKYDYIYVVMKTMTTVINSGFCIIHPAIYDNVITELNISNKPIDEDDSDIDDEDTNKEQKYNSEIKEICYLPTAHGYTMNSGDVVLYDIECFIFGSIKYKDHIINPIKSIKWNNQNENTNKFIMSLDNIIFEFNNMTSGKIKIDYNQITNLNYTEMYDNMPNINLWQQRPI